MCNIDDGEGWGTLLVDRRIVPLYRMKCDECGRQFTSDEPAGRVRVWLGGDGGDPRSQAETAFDQADEAAAKAAGTDAYEAWTRSRWISTERDADVEAAREAQLDTIEDDDPTTWPASTAFEVTTFTTCPHCAAAGVWLDVVCGGYMFGTLREQLDEHWDEDPVYRSAVLGRLVAGTRRGWRVRNRGPAALDAAVAGQPVPLMPVPDVAEVARVAYLCTGPPCETCSGLIVATRQDGGLRWRHTTPDHDDHPAAPAIPDDAFMARHTR